MSYLSCFRCCISNGSEPTFRNENSENASPAQSRSSRRKRSKSNTPSEIRYNPRTERVSFEESQGDNRHAPTSKQLSLDNVSALYATVDKSKKSQIIGRTSGVWRETGINTRTNIENENSVHPTANNPSLTNQRTTRFPLPISNEPDLSYSRIPIRNVSTNFNQKNILRQDSFDTALYASCSPDGRTSGSDFYAEILSDNTSTSYMSINPNTTSASQLARLPSTNDSQPSDANSNSIYIYRLNTARPVLRSATSIWISTRSRWNVLIVSLLINQLFSFWCGV